MLIIVYIYIKFLWTKWSSIITSVVYPEGRNALIVQYNYKNKKKLYVLVYFNSTTIEGANYNTSRQNTKKIKSENYYIYEVMRKLSWISSIIPQVPRNAVADAIIPLVSKSLQLLLIRDVDARGLSIDMTITI